MEPQETDTTSTYVPPRWRMVFRFAVYDSAWLREWWDAAHAEPFDIVDAFAERVHSMFDDPNGAFTWSPDAVVGGSDVFGYFVEALGDGAPHPLDWQRARAHLSTGGTHVWASHVEIAQ